MHAWFSVESSTFTLVSRPARLSKLLELCWRAFLLVCSLRSPHCLMHGVRASPDSTIELHSSLLSSLTGHVLDIIPKMPFYILLQSTSECALHLECFANKEVQVYHESRFSYWNFFSMRKRESSLEYRIRAFNEAFDNYNKKYSSRHKEGKYPLMIAWHLGSNWGNIRPPFHIWSRVVTASLYLQSSMRMIYEGRTYMFREMWCYQ